MAALLRNCLPLAVLLAFGVVRAAPPVGLVQALEYLRDQRSYSWEMINGDPGPVAQRFETRRGTVTTVTQSTLPNIKGQIDRQGDTLIVREWSDGLRLETFLSAEGAMITLTPEGWLTDREILTAQAEERLRHRSPTPRALWLRRADRPDIRRPDQELVPLLQSKIAFETAPEGYIVRIRSRAGDPSQPSEDENEPSIDVKLTLNVRHGVVRDYEVKIEAVRHATRARLAVPISEQRMVVITYVPVPRIALPEEARAKLAAARSRSAR